MHRTSARQRYIRSGLALLALLLCLLALPAPAAAAEPSCAVLGDSWDYTLLHQVRIYNSGSSAATDVTVTVQLDDGWSPVYNQLAGRELSPYPQRIFTDADGHTYAEYQLDRLAAGQSLTLTQRYAMTLSAVSYDFDVTQVEDVYSAEEQAELAAYLRPTATVQSTDSRVAAFVRGVLGTETDPYRKARLLFSAVNLALDYDETVRAQDAVSALVRGTASCEGFANLYAACLRAAGVPCRQLSGYLYRPDKHMSSQYVDEASGRWLLDSLGHAWVEFYLPQLGWIMADPTFTYAITINGVEQRFIDWSCFAMIADSRRYFSLRSGVEVDNVSISATGGSVRGEFSATMEPGLDFSLFPDIRSHWAEADINYCVQNSLFNGVSAGSFAPDAAMSRAMFVTVLGRLYEQLGHDLSYYDDGLQYFSDAPEEQYYSTYLNWAVDQGIITGYGDGRFGPNDNVTREQMARMLALFLHTLGQPLTENASLTFADADTVAEWAQAAVATCAQRGLIAGLPGNIFAPQRNASRAQVATILHRLCLTLDE